MKKTRLIFLFVLSFVVLGLVNVSATTYLARKMLNKTNDQVNNELNELFNEYYNDGYYVKDTKVYLNEKATEELTVLGCWHANVSLLERTTYYKGDALWMSNHLGGYSYYGTSDNNMTHAYVSSLEETSNNVVVSGQTMEEYYYTLFDLTAKNEHGWSEENGVYTSEDDEVIEWFKAITAPCYLGFEDDKSNNYITLSYVSVTVEGGYLVLRLHAPTNEGALTNADIFSEAVIHYQKKYSLTIDGEYIGTVLEGQKLNLEEPTKTGYEFSGWYIGDKLWDLENDVVSSDIYLTTKWEDADYMMRNDKYVLNRIQTLNNIASHYWYLSYEENGLRILVDVVDDEIYTANTDTGMNDNIEFIVGMNTSNDSLAPNNSFNAMITLGRNDQNWAQQAKDYSSYGGNIYNNLLENGTMVVNKKFTSRDADGFDGMTVEIFLNYSLWNVDKNTASGNMAILIGGRNNDANGNTLFRFFVEHGGIWNKVNTASRILVDGTLVNNYFDLPDLEVSLQNTTQYQDGKTIADNMAVLTATDNSLVREYTVGAQLWTDRDYYADEDGMFEALDGKSFFRNKMDGSISFKVSEAGYVVIAVPADGSFSAGNTSILTSNGFVLLAGYMPALGYNSVSYFMGEEINYYVKWCDAGETYKLNKWAVIIFDSQETYEEDTWIKTAGTVIKLDTEELKAKYAPTTRLWQGIPGITSVQTANGTRLWASWFTGSDKEPRVGNYAVYYYSDDDGENWIPAFVATFDYDVVNDSRLYDPSIFTDNDNNLYLWWNQTNYSFGSGSVWYSKISNADQDFESMEAMTPVCTGPGLKLNKPIITSTGEWLYAAHDVTDRTNTYIYASNDNGLTWTVKGACDVYNGRAFFEPTIVEVLDDNSDEVTLMMWNRCTESYNISVSYSYDGGVTWTTPSEFIPTNTMYSGPSSRMNSLSFTHNGVNYIAYLQHYNTTSRNNIAIFLSNDGGKTFPYALILDTNSGVSYPDVRYIDDHLYVVWDYNRYGEKRVFMAKLTVEEILAVDKVGVLDRSRIQFISSLTTANAPLNLSGYAYDTDGNPLNGATVTYGSYVTTTDSNGYYEFNNIYYVANEKVVISKEDYFSSEIKLTENMVIDSEFNYKTTSHLEKINELNVFGILKDRYGNVLSDAFVTIGDASVKTDENGYYEVNNILPNINVDELTMVINCDINSDYVATIPYSQFNSENNYTVELNLEILEDNVTDLGYVGNEGANGYYRIYAIRTETSVVIEALTYVPLTSSGLDKLEIFMSVDKFYGVGGSGARNSEFVLFNIFSSGLIRGWNWPNNVKSKDNVLFKFGNNKVTSNGVNITNTVTISQTGLNKIYFEVPYAFFQNLNTQEKGLDSVAGNTVVNKSTPIGFYILSGYKEGGTTWKSYDNWSYKVANNSYKNYPYDLPILTHDNSIVNNYATYMNNVLSSFDSLSNYVEAVYGKGLEGNMATFSGHTTKTYTAGSPLFSDRDSSFHGVPANGGVKALSGLTFIYDSVTGNNISIKANKSGYLLMAMDDNNITKADVANWDFISKSYLPNLGVSTVAKSASLYIIWIEEGQTISVPANTLVFTK